MIQTKENILSLPKGSTVFTQGQKIDYVYLLLHGQVSLWKQGSKLLELEGYHALGLEGLYGADPLSVYRYQLKTETECRFKKLLPNEIPTALSKSPKIWESILSSLGSQLSRCLSLAATSQQAEKQTYFAGDIKVCFPGEYVIHEGQYSNEIYRIVSTDQGLEVSKTGQILAILTKPGEFFGEMAAVLNEPRTATVRSVGHSLLEVYPGEVIMEVLSDYPELSYKLISGLSSRLAQANKRLTSSKE